MDEIINNVKSVASTLAGIVASLAGAAEALGYKLDPTILQKVDTTAVALVVVGVYLIFGQGKKKT